MEDNEFNSNSLLKCVELTNKVVYKWIYINRVKIDNINKEAINSLFIGYLKKYIKNYNIFNRIRRLINILIDPKTKYIKQVFISNIDRYPYDNSLKYYQNIFDSLNEDSYSFCIPNLSLEFKELNINFKEIENINF